MGKARIGSSLPGFILSVVPRRLRVFGEKLELEFVVHAPPSASTTQPTRLVSHAEELRRIVTFVDGTRS